MNLAALGCRLFAAAAGVSLCTAACAAEWEPVTDTENAIYLVDRGSVSVADGTKHAWVLVTGPYGRGLPDYGSRTQFMVFNCNDHAVALKEYVLHALPGGQGAVLLSEAYEDSKLEFTRPGPDSVGSKLLGAVCGQ
jgi:hypothetical protein